MASHTRFCEALLAESASSLSIPSASLDELLVARYAVIVQRDDETWLRVAADISGVAEIELETLVATEGYDEWVTAVWCVAEQRRVRYSPRVVVWIGDVAVQTRLPHR